MSIRKIAAKIEYSPTTIYLYYKDKAEIIADMAVELYTKVMQNIAIENTMLSAEKQACRIMQLFIQSLCAEPEMVKAVMYSGVNVVFENESATGKPENPGITMFDNLIADGINQKIFRPAVAGNSWMIVSAMLGFVMSCIENQTYLLDNFDQLTCDFVDILMGGIIK